MSATASLIAFLAMIAQLDPVTAAKVRTLSYTPRRVPTSEVPVIEPQKRASTVPSRTEQRKPSSSSPNLSSLEHSDEEDYGKNLSGSDVEEALETGVEDEPPEPEVESNVSGSEVREESPEQNDDDTKEPDQGNTGLEPGSDEAVLFEAYARMNASEQPIPHEDSTTDAIIRSLNEVGETMSEFAEKGESSKGDEPPSTTEGTLEVEGRSSASHSSEEEVDEEAPTEVTPSSESGLPKREGSEEPKPNVSETQRQETEDTGSEEESAPKERESDVSGTQTTIEETQRQETDYTGSEEELVTEEPVPKELKPGFEEVQPVQENTESGED